MSEVPESEPPEGEEGDLRPSSIIEDGGAVVPDEATQPMLDQAMTDVLAHLSPRERDVVRLRFGLEDGTIRTLEEVSEEFGLTRQRVRQIESKTLGILGRPDHELRLVRLIRRTEPNCSVELSQGSYIPVLHSDLQDTDCAAWRRLLDLIDEAAKDGREEFAPGHDMPKAFWRQIVTLPPSIAKLTAVKRLDLYGSNLIALPPEIGDMRGLEAFHPYTSRRLHWFPFEITKCTRLAKSVVSTRNVYGNFKFRPPFPKLPAMLPSGSTPASCSVCQGAFPSSGAIQVWIRFGWRRTFFRSWYTPAQRSASEPCRGRRQDMRTSLTKEVQILVQPECHPIYRSILGPEEADHVTELAEEMGQALNGPTSL